MPFIPHTENDVREMLKTIGVERINDLFDEIPQSLRVGSLDGIPEGMTEMQVTRHMQALAATDGTPLNFAGSGAYEHHIPAAVWEITTRGEFYSAYTPYQAEASQGTLQVIYEFQTMMAKLLGMEVSNASLYDGATSMAEAILMAVRANRKDKTQRILVPRSIHPTYRKVVQTIVSSQGLTLEEIDYDGETGTINPDSVKAWKDKGYAALVIPQPNFFGNLEPVDALTNAAHEAGALAIAVVNPLAMSILKPPGQWGDNGVDIACGEGQPLGVPLSSGGPYYGLLCCKQAIVRQMPGRLVGRTTDMDGKPGFALTLQAREQHIRRGKATSNICTNQGLAVTASTIHMALLGPEGLERVARASVVNTARLMDLVAGIDGVTVLFRSPRFHEFVVQLPIPADSVIEKMAAEKIVAGYGIGHHYPELGNAMAVCATETKTEDDLAMYVAALQRAIQ
ncbi:MAG: putative glycine dehydrogenase (decarboxylating) subunit 1 [Lysobacteraceae bacterium]|nr:MAG: putative glycine dehydrogenase (decarboxylating) subunit 1 [Xanthomonadaceae bacterium]